MDGFYVKSRRAGKQLRAFDTLREAVPVVTTYWRINITRTDTDQTSISLGEIEMMALVGSGVDLCTGGTPSASNEFDGNHGAIKAFDNDNATTWATVSSQVPGWIQYILSSATTINQVTIRGRTEGGSTFGQSPREFTIQSSMDSGTTWIDEWAVTGQTGWGTGEVRTFTRPSAA